MSNYQHDYSQQELDDIKALQLQQDDVTHYYAKHNTDPEWHIGQTGWAGKTLCGLELRAEGAYTSTDLLAPNKHLCASCLMREAELAKNTGG